MTERQHATAKRRRAMGFTYAAIARSLGMTRDELSAAYRRRHDDRRRDRRNAQRRCERAVAALLADGFDAKEIAPAFGLTPARVRRIGKRG